MTKDEVIEALKKLQTSTDTEMAHGDADDLICEFLRSLGYDDVVDAFDAIDKWYA